MHATETEAHSRPAAGTAHPFALACPRCGLALAADGDAAWCAECGESYARRDGIWRFLLPERERELRPFLSDYQAVRAREGWGAADASYYRALPQVPRDDPQRAIWRLRRRSFATLLEQVIEPIERGRPAVKTLDLGAGNGWLAARLAERGHVVAAVDRQDGQRDGLGAHVHYRAGFTPIQAEFDRLPLAGDQFDLVVFNAALLSAAVYARTLREALRVLRPDGALVVVDTPVYHDARSGAQMLRERQQRFAAEHGIAGVALPCEGFLSYRRIGELAAELGLGARLLAPRGAWRAPAWRALARLRGRREPASFPLVVLRRRDVGHGAHPRRSRLVRRLWRAGIGWRFRLFQRHRYDRLVIERVGDAPVVVLPQVFNPTLLFSGDFLARALDERLIPRGAAVLDMGTGSGVGAVFAARWAGRVVAVDINPAAVRCAQINALLHHVEDRVTVHQGDLFAPVRGQRFDVVLFNPPVFRGAPRSPLDYAWRSEDTVERFAAGLPDHLNPGGHALVVLSSNGETPAFLAAFRANGLEVSVVAERDLVSEVLTIYRLRVAIARGKP
jgi:HemK-related putative methylase